MSIEIRTVRNRPVQVQAVRATTDNLQEISDWITGHGGATQLGNGQLIIQTLEGPFTVRPGDEVIRGLAGEFYRHEGGEFFEKAYEEISHPVAAQET